MENNKLILKHKWKCKGPKMVKTILQKNIGKDLGNSIKPQLAIQCGTGIKADKQNNGTKYRIQN